MAITSMKVLISITAHSSWVKQSLFFGWFGARSCRGFAQGSSLPGHTGNDKTTTTIS
jgi:hypothetical protein